MSENTNIITGVAGSATEYVASPEEQKKRPTMVAAWFLDCPGQSPAWRHFVLSVVHLRPVEGVPPAVITLEGATHEVLLAALDPTANPCAEDCESWEPLHPLNLVKQIRVPSDEAAKRILEICARAVVQGLLWAEPPLSGQVVPWRQHLDHLAAHARGEH